MRYFLDSQFPLRLNRIWPQVARGSDGDTGYSIHTTMSVFVSLVPALLNAIRDFVYKHKNALISIQCIHGSIRKHIYCTRIQH